jgi:hypothetical protein
MKKNVIICGLIAGFISIIGFLLVDFENMNLDNSMVYGYASMLLAFSLIFVGIKNYRDKYNNGVVSFGKAFRIGLYISLIASTIYVITWMIDSTYFIPDFTDKYAAHMVEKLKASGASQAEIDKQVLEMGKFKEMYKNPLFRAMITYVEILPIGIIISLIAAAILKRKENHNGIKAPDMASMA